MRRIKLLAGVALVAVTLTAGSRAARADIVEAKRHYAAAEKAFKAGSYKEALGLYRKAYAAKPLNGFHYNMGLCLRKLNHHSAAITELRQYVDGAKREKSKLRGRALIALCEADIAAGKDVPYIDPAKAKPKPTVTPKPTPTPKPKPKPDPAERKGLHPVWFWASVATTGVLFAVGMGTGIAALNKDSEFNDTSLSKTNEELRDLQSSGRTLAAVSTVMFIGAALAAAGATFLFFKTRFDSEKDDAADDKGKSDKPASATTSTLSAAPLPDGGVYLSWGLRF